MGGNPGARHKMGSRVAAVFKSCLPFNCSAGKVHLPPALGCLPRLLGQRERQAGAPGSQEGTGHVPAS